MTSLVFLLQVGLLLLLGSACAHLLRSAAFGWRLPRLPVLPAPMIDQAGEGAEDLPAVTIQLPIYNEAAVVERLLRAVGSISWPRDRLEVQALDDSTDETSAIIEKVAAELRGDGLSILVLRRGDRVGWKAGNLQHGLSAAQGEFIAVLDADSLPPTDFLRRLVPTLLAEPGLGFVQGRWSFVNEGAGLLTRVQAIILHGLFLVEQARLSALGLPVQFNGTAGIWRRSALLAAGGWLQATPGSILTEDLDLSYRALLAGFSGRTVPEVAVGSELPESMAAFRVQQVRWVRGGAEVLRALHRRLLLGTLPKRERVTLLGHLVRHARQPFLLLMALWIPLPCLDLVHTRLSVPFLWPAAVGITVLSVVAYYGVALRRLRRSWGSAIWLGPLVCTLSLGLSLGLSVALWLGLLSAKEAVFHRTPKTGGRRPAEGPAAQPIAGRRSPPSAGRGGLSTAKRGGPSIAIFEILEILIGAAYVALAWVALRRGEWGAGLFFLGFMAGGYLWVGAGTLRSRCVRP